MVTGQLQATFAVGGTLTVTGATTLADANVNGTLTVTGDAVFTGNLTVQNISVMNITVNGKIITAGNAPTISAGVGVGTGAMLRW